MVLVWTSVEGWSDEAFREVMDNKIYLHKSEALRVANEFADAQGFPIYNDFAPDGTKQWVSIDSYAVVG